MNKIELQQEQRIFEKRHARRRARSGVEAILERERMLARIASRLNPEEAVNPIPSSFRHHRKTKR